MKLLIKNKLIGFFVIIISLSNCKTDSSLDKGDEYDAKAIVIPENIELTKNLFDIMEGLKITELSKNKSKEFIFSTIDKVVYFNDKLYMKTKLNELYLLNSNGLLEKTLNGKGLGPNEYRSIHDFKINEISKEIFVHDFEKQRFLVYDLNFNYKRTENIGLNFMFFEFLSKNIVLFTAKHRNNINETYHDYDLFIVDEKFNINLKSLPFNASLFTTTRLHKKKSFFQLGKKVLFNDLVSDTIYEIRKDSVIPFKYYKYNRNTFTSEIKNGSHELLLKELNENLEKFDKLDFLASLIAVNSKNLYLSSFVRGDRTIYSFADLENQTKYYSFPKEFDDINHKSIFDIKTKNNKEEFISLVYPYILRFIKKQYIEKYKNEDFFTKKIDTILSNTTDDGNQVLLKFKIKK